MKKYIYAKGSSLITFNDENIENIGTSINTIEHCYTNIDWSWLIPEDGQLFMYDNVYEVKANDLVFCLYSGCKKREIVIIHSDEWVNNIKRREEEDKKNCECCDACAPETPRSQNC